MSNDDDIFDIEIDEENEIMEEFDDKKSERKMKIVNRSLKNPDEIFSASNLFFNSKHESKDISGENSEIKEFLNTLINTSDDEKFQDHLEQLK